MYYLRVTVTMTFDLVFRIIMSGAYLLYYLRKESQIWCVNASGDGGWRMEECPVPFSGHCDLVL